MEHSANEHEKYQMWNGKRSYKKAVVSKLDKMHFIEKAIANGIPNEELGKYIKYLFEGEAEEL